MRHRLRFVWLWLATSAFAHAPAPRGFAPVIHGDVRGYAYAVAKHLASGPGAGNMTSRTFGNGTSQTLSWDGLGRLVSVIQRDSANNGYNWTATYDALGRRLRTTHTPVTANVAYPLQTLTIGSIYDPQVEFQELAVTLNPDLRNGPGAQRTWKVFGHDD